MESIILWGIGILVYLLIGFGVMLVNKEIIEKEGETLDKIAFIYCILGWPIELGRLITRASYYYEAERNTLYMAFHRPEKPFKEAIWGEVVVLSMKIGEHRKNSRKYRNLNPKEQ